MTGLALVREEYVRVDELRAGDVLILQSARRVTVERIDEYDEGLVVRWWRPADRGEPGHRGAKDHTRAVADEWDGRYLGSLQLLKASDVVRVDRG